MRRRVYTGPDKSKRLKQEALLELRRTRRLVDPALLNQVKMLIMARQHASENAVRQDNGGLDGAGGAIARDTPVDRKKTMLTIMKFLEMRQDSTHLHKRVHALMQDTIK